jgi:hypothetical protein
MLRLLINNNIKSQSKFEEIYLEEQRQPKSKLNFELNQNFSESIKVNVRKNKTKISQQNNFKI